MSQSVMPPFPIYPDIDGEPLQEGFIYIGVANLDPQTNPIPTYFNPDLTDSATQPIRTLDGYAVKAGAPANIYVENDYSIMVTNKNGSLVWSAPSITARTNIDLLTFIQQGSTVVRPLQTKVRERFSLDDFGAVGDGVHDDTAMIVACLAAAATYGVKTVYAQGKRYLISSSILVPEGIVIEGEGHTAAYSDGGEGEPSMFIKKSTMTTDGIILNGKRSGLRNIGVFPEPGATGNGIWLSNNYQTLESVSSNGHAGIGILIGSKIAAYRSTNFFTLKDIEASYNGSHGIYVNDGFQSYPLADCSAGSIINFSCRHNGGDGLRVGNSALNTYINGLTENNTGYGINFTNQSVKSSLSGGDTDEGNTLGQLNNSGLYNFFSCQTNSGFTNTGGFLTYFGYVSTILPPTTILGAETITQTSYTGLLDFLTLNGQGLGDPGNGVSQVFNTPSTGDGSPGRRGTVLSSINAIESNTNNLTIQMRNAGSLSTMYTLYGSATTLSKNNQGNGSAGTVNYEEPAFCYGGDDSFFPGIWFANGYNGDRRTNMMVKLYTATNTFFESTRWDHLGNFYPGVTNVGSCGKSGFLWTEVWATNGTIQVSDERKKMEITPSNLGLDFINELRPVSYKWKQGDGEIVQDESDYEDIEVPDFEIQLVDDISEVIKEIDGKFVKTFEKKLVEKKVFIGENVDLYDENGEVIGTHFVPKMKTVREYKSKMVYKPGGRNHYGFIAQEVQSILQKSNIDFAGWVLTDKNNPESDQALRYEEFISPIVCAIQELTEKVNKLEGEKK